MKGIRFIILLIGIMILLTGKEAFAETTLQSQIDKTPEGGTLRLNSDRYHESIVLKKSIHLIGGRGTTFISCSSNPVVTITGKNVTVRGVSIEGCQNISTTPAIYISGRNHQLDDIIIHSGGAGVKLANAENTVVTNVKLSGMGRERGFDLWQSNRNTFRANELDHVQDGFYMENSHLNTFIGNKICDSRYGLHVMFSDYIKIQQNISVRNTAGAMIMSVRYSTIQGNTFKDNNQNVNAQGLLLYDTHQSIVRNNIVKYNRVGLYIDQSSDNKMVNNQISANFIGAQLNNTNKNIIERNSFVSNVADLQANHSAYNKIRQNYWDAAWKLNTNGDEMSNIPYRADPYFFNLIAETPEYQLFFQDPGMILLQKMLKSTKQEAVTDGSPLVTNQRTRDYQVQAGKDTKVEWIISIIMIVMSLLFIFGGRKRN